MMSLNQSVFPKKKKEKKINSSSSNLASIVLMAKFVVIGLADAEGSANARIDLSCQLILTWQIVTTLAGQSPTSHTGSVQQLTVKRLTI